MLRKPPVTLTTAELTDLWRKLNEFSSYVVLPDFLESPDNREVESCPDSNDDLIPRYDHYFHKDLREIEWRHRSFDNTIENIDRNECPALFLSDRQIRFLIHEDIWDISLDSWSVDHDEILDSFDEWLSSKILNEPFPQP